MRFLIIKNLTIHYMRCVALGLTVLSCSHVKMFPSPSPKTSSPPTPSPIPSASVDKALGSYCYETLKKLPGKYHKARLRKACSRVLLKEGCVSPKNRSIFHYDKLSERVGGTRILVLALIHGDEFPSGSVARAWMERLEELDPRNSWRVIPVANPDGLVLKTRTNANRVDINRNFPTENWDQLALKMWKERYKSTWRKYPGPAPASEVETRCLMAHIKDFSSDFIISIHTPLGHLDFDGPKMKYPNFNLLPWRRFGHFPGSLGRYMWKDHGIPVLTVELKGNDPIKSFEVLDNLQDISGTLAIKALDRSKASSKASH
ncbi:MAG: succinylglutamate desuccinylase/aspartoacylase family protein [Bacteriovoracales bacterium]|nr:succinylglutamate desuccinylase/aspartoacylase family protein [Bacteriovoracales bacterium]